MGFIPGYFIVVGGMWSFFSLAWIDGWLYLCLLYANIGCLGKIFFKCSSFSIIFQCLVRHSLVFLYHGVYVSEH